jgi:hypothetical protein
MQQIHSLKEFLDSYGPSLATRVNDELEVIHGITQPAEIKPLKR